MSNAAVIQLQHRAAAEAAAARVSGAEALVHAEMKRGIGSLATIGSSAPFVGLFGTVVGIINAFKGISTEKSTGLGAVAGGISEALVTTAVGLFVALPAVWMYNYFSGRIEAFDTEMGNSSSELIDYFVNEYAAARTPNPCGTTSAVLLNRSARASAKFYSLRSPAQLARQLPRD